MEQSKFPPYSDYYHANLAKLILGEDHTKSLSDWVKNPKDFLLYLGSAGCGKTYFCSALCNLLTEQKKQYLYMTERDFFSTLRADIAQGWDYNYRLDNGFRCIPFLILDDLGSSQMTEWQKEALFILIDNRSIDRKPTVITSNLYVPALKETFNPRFVSRLTAARNTILQLKEEDLRQLNFETK